MNAPSLDLLLADDDIDDCLLFKEALDELQVPANLTTVFNGEDLMQFLLAKKDALPDILFLDLNMPRKNGFECLSQIRSNEDLNALPVVIYSTSSDANVIKQLHQHGAKYYIQKPTEFSLLKKVIQRALSLIYPQISPAAAEENFVIEP